MLSRRNHLATAIFLFITFLCLATQIYSKKKKVVFHLDAQHISNWTVWVSTLKDMGIWRFIFLYGHVAYGLDWLENIFVILIHRFLYMSKHCKRLSGIIKQLSDFKGTFPYMEITFNEVAGQLLSKKKKLASCHDT